MTLNFPNFVSNSIWQNQALFTQKWLKEHSFYVIKEIRHLSVERCRMWRYRPDLNWRMRVLQTLALPLGHGTGFGAGDEARTRYLHLGKVALYRMSYTRILVPPVGIEPTTRGFSVRCSTYWATEACSGELRSPQMLYGDPERTRTVDLQRDRLAC